MVILAKIPMSASMSSRAPVRDPIPWRISSAAFRWLRRGSVVQGDPALDRVLGGPPPPGEDDGLGASPETFPGDVLGQVLERFEGVMIGGELRQGKPLPPPK